MGQALRVSWDGYLLVAFGGLTGVRSMSFVVEPDRQELSCANTAPPLRRRSRRPRTWPTSSSTARTDEPQAVVLRRRAPDGGPAWHDVTAGQFRDEVSALAKGLVAAGIGAGDRVALLSRTRYEWTVADYAIWSAGAVTVPIYETSSAEQVEWILGDSGARALIAETPGHLQAAADVAGQAARRAAGLADRQGHRGRRGRPADRRHPGRPGRGGRRRRRGRPGRAPGRPRRRRPGHHHLHLGHDRPPEGLPAHPREPARRRAQRDRRAAGDLLGAGRSALLFLPLAHSFARIIQVGCLESGTVMGHTADVASLVADLGSFQPTFILAVPRVFEKVYNGAELQASASRLKGRIFAAAARTAIEWSGTLGSSGRPLRGSQPLRLRAAHAACDRLVYSKLRAATGGRVAVRRVGRRAARRAARALLPRRRHHRAGGLRADRDQPGDLGQPARPQQDRLGRRSRFPGSACGSPRTARSWLRAERVPGLLAQRRGDGRDDRRRRLAAHRGPRRA